FHPPTQHSNLPFFPTRRSSDHPKVCVINQKLAQRSSAGPNPIGLHITHGGGKLYADPPMEIVGLVANSKWDDARSDIVPFLYMRSEEHTSELQSRFELVCRLLL